MPIIGSLWRFRDKITPILLNQKVIFLFFCVVTVIVSIQKCVTDNYGVYRIYKTAALDFTSHIIPYTQASGYLYSPTFAAFFLSFAYLPDILGCILWNLLSVVLLLVSINLLSLENKEKSIIFGIIFFEAVGCLQNYQANIIAAAFMLFVFVALERNKCFMAALCAALGVFIKIFGAGFAILFVFYPKKTKFLLYMVTSIIALSLFPLFFVDFDTSYLFALYKGWAQELGRNAKNDPDHYISFFTILQTWFKCKINVGSVNSSGLIQLIQAVSLFILALPLVRLSKYKNFTYRLMFLSSLLIWVVIFNPKAESPTYVIAMLGVAIWFISQKPTPLNIALLVLAILFTSLSKSDLFFLIKKHLPYGTKAAFCIVIWFIIQFQLLFSRHRKSVRP